MMRGWTVLVMLVGCGSQSGVRAGKSTAGSGGDSATSSVDTSVTGAGDTADTADTADMVPAPARCPADMVPVPAEAPQFCIDRHEGAVSDDGRTVRSEAGLTPTTGISFDEARTLCAQTPVVVEGVDHGFRRLATLSEWTDAFDGELGPGGSTYPTGEAWPETECAVVGADGSSRYDALQPTGSHPECVSRFGVYDQLGNIWEWADPELDVEVATFVERRAAEGLELSVTPEGAVMVGAGSPTDLRVEVPGLFAQLSVDETGRVVASDVTFQATEPFDYVGYLVSVEDIARDRTGFALPVRITREDGIELAEVAPLTVRWDEDGTPLTAKVGCAYYSGTPMGCTASDWFFGHPREFSGTIGVRCAADPVD